MIFLFLCHFIYPFTIYGVDCAIAWVIDKLKLCHAISSLDYVLILHRRILDYKPGMPRRLVIPRPPPLDNLASPPWDSAYNFCMVSPLRQLGLLFRHHFHLNQIEKIYNYDFPLSIHQKKKIFHYLYMLPEMSRWAFVASKSLPPAPSPPSRAFFLDPIEEIL
jgi:hypothetical protein